MIKLTKLLKEIQIQAVPLIKGRLYRFKDYGDDEWRNNYEYNGKNSDGNYVFLDTESYPDTDTMVLDPKDLKEYINDDRIKIQDEDAHYNSMGDILQEIQIDIPNEKEKKDWFKFYNENIHIIENSGLESLDDVENKFHEIKEKILDALKNKMIGLRINNWEFNEQIYWTADTRLEHRYGLDYYNFKYFFKGLLKYKKQNQLNEIQISLYKFDDYNFYEGIYKGGSESISEYLRIDQIANFMSLGNGRICLLPSADENSFVFVMDKKYFELNSVMTVWGNPSPKEYMKYIKQKIEEGKIIKL